MKQLIEKLKKSNESIENIRLEFPMEDGSTELVLIRPYLPAVEKQELIAYIANGCMITDAETGLLKVDEHLLEVLSTYFIVKRYTNIQLTDDIYDMYDVLKMSGLSDEIMYSERGMYEEELLDLQYAIRAEIDEIIRVNEKSISLGAKFKELIKEFNETIMTTSSIMENMDLEALKGATPLKEIGAVATK